LSLVELGAFVPGMSARARQVTMDGRDVGYSRNNLVFSLRRGRGAALRGVGVGALMLLAGFLLTSVCRGQAMGKITVDGPSPLPVALPVEAAKSDAAKPAAVVPMDRGTTQGTDVAANFGMTRPTNLTQPPASNTPAPIKATSPVAPAGSQSDVEARTPAAVPVPVEAPKQPATNPGGAEAAKAVGIEQQPIRGNGGEAAKGATPDAQSAGSGLPSLGLGQVLAALAIVVGLIFVGRALVRKFVPGAAASSGKGVIEILARHPLAKNQSLVLVRIGSQIVALNQGREASESVLVISEPMEVARIIGQIEGKNPASIQAGFNKLLANARMDLEGGEAEPDLKDMGEENLDEQLEEMAAAKRQLMELRQHVRSVRDSLPRE
jgi:flagellar biogenesis protein FliO